MSDVAIRVEGLGKQYRIGAKQERYRTLRDVLADTVAAPFRRAGRLLRGEATGAAGLNETIWALKDVSFEVRHGEVVGIIGRNGAGKSTLLKILSRITEPTAGYVDLYGRVGSLLEVGTGFHPELTGRENIYLNGAILGMRRAEINRKFDEIVAFAEIEKFIDTPVKHYSSGMYVRLAFAVAAHLEPEILLVDEVLAVGDAQFQKKCFNRMREVGHGGRTILFVSHNMAAVRSICRWGIVLERGQLVQMGDIDEVVDAYFARITTCDAQGLIQTGSFIVDDVQIRSLNGPVIRTFDPVEISVAFTAKTNVYDPGLYVGVLTLDGERLLGIDFKDFGTAPRIQRGVQGMLGFHIERLPLLPGTYQMEIHLKDMAKYSYEMVPYTFPFEVAETPVYGGRKLDKWYGHIGLDARPIYAVPYEAGL